MYRTLDKPQKLDDKEESLTILSRDSTNISIFKPSCPGPSIKVIGFRNFVPAFEIKTSDEDSKLVRDFKDFKEGRLDESQIIFKLAKFEETVQSTIIEVFETGPFLIFIYNEFMRNSHPQSLQSLEKLKVEFNYKVISPREDLFNEEDLFTMKIFETDCVYIVPKENFSQKIQLYAIPEDKWEDIALQTLGNQVNTISTMLGGKSGLDQDLLVPLGSVHRGVFGDCYRHFCKDSKSYYGITDITIKCPEALVQILQELDAIITVLKSKHADLLSLISVKLWEREEYNPIKIRFISRLGLGTIEEFAAYRKQTQEEWEEEDLLKLTASLLKQSKILDELKISIRDIRPSNITISKDSKDLKFLDLSMSCLYNNNSSLTEIAGTPKYMAWEVLNNSDQLTVLRHESCLADLYSIGLVILELACAGQYNKVLSRKDLVNEDTKEVISEKYPILWERYLCKLLEEDPVKRKEAIKGLKLLREDFSFIEKRSLGFEGFVAKKEFKGKKEVLGDFDSLLPYFWQLECFTLIEEMEKTIFERYSTKEGCIRKVTRFCEMLATLHEKNGMKDKALSVYERLIELLEVEDSKKSSEEDREEYNNLILELASKVGSLYKSQGKYPKALENYEKALYYEYLKDSDDEVYDFSSHIEIAEVYEELGHRDLALDAYLKVLKRFQKSFKSNTNLLQEGILYEKIGGLYYRGDEFEQAVENISKAIESYTTCYGQHHTSVANCERLLGHILMKKGDQDQATIHYETYFAIQSHGPNKHDLEFVKLMEEIADNYYSKGSYTHAIENYQRALAVYKYHDYSNDLCRLYEKLAECYSLQKKYILAVKTLRQCFKAKEEALGENNLELIPIIEKMANNFIQDGEHNEALKEHSRALSIAMLHKEQEDPLVEGILAKIGKISPLAFLAYKNYKTVKAGTGSNNTTPLLISLNRIEDVRGVLGGIDFDIVLQDLRDLIAKQCNYLKFFTYEFTRQGKIVESPEENSVKLQECVIVRDGFNHLVIQEGKNFERERATY